MWSGSSVDHKAVRRLLQNLGGVGEGSSGQAGGSERLVRRWSERPQFLASTAETGSKLGVLVIMRDILACAVLCSNCSIEQVVRFGAMRRSLGWVVNLGMAKDQGAGLGRA